MKIALAFLLMTTAANAADDKLEVAAFMLITKNICKEQVDERALEYNVVVGSRERNIDTEQGRWFAAGMGRAYANILVGHNALKDYCGVK